MENIIRYLNNSNRIAIFTHVVADFDCIGSAVALKEALQKLGKDVTIFVGDNSYTERFEILTDKSPFLRDLMPENFDLYIAVDVADSKLLGVYKNKFLNFNNTVCIDHHISNTKYANYTYLKNLPSCCEIIYDIIKKLKLTVGEKMAMALYSGIISDTLCMSIDAVGSHTYKVLYELSKIKFDFSNVLDKSYRIKTLTDIKTEAFVLENFKINNGVAYLIVKNKDYKKIGIKATDFSCAEYVNNMLYVEGVKFAILVGQIEKKNYKASLRCQRGYDVNVIASTINGGGHPQAAGARFTGNVDEELTKLIALCEKQIKDSENV